MNILVFSDSHGCVSNMLEAYRRQIKKPDAIIFLGDGLRDLSCCDFGEIPTFAVTGNNDMLNFFGKGYAEDEIVMTLGGKKIMMTHRDRYAVKLGMARLVAEADKKGADIVLFGHTHEAFEKYLPAGKCEYGVDLKKPLYIFNPGSVGRYDATFGTIEFKDNGEVMFSHGAL